MRAETHFVSPIDGNTGTRPCISLYGNDGGNDSSNDWNENGNLKGALVHVWNWNKKGNLKNTLVDSRQGFAAAPQPLDCKNNRHQAGTSCSSIVNRALGSRPALRVVE